MIYLIVQNENIDSFLNACPIFKEKSPIRYAISNPKKNCRFFELHGSTIEIVEYVLELNQRGAEFECVAKCEEINNFFYH